MDDNGRGDGAHADVRSPCPVSSEPQPLPGSQAMAHHLVGPHQELVVEEAPANNSINISV